jgi:hypothetical protein
LLFLEINEGLTKKLWTIGCEANIKDVALVSGSADNTAKVWKTNANGKVNNK